ncbi:unnamed protein product, partial [Ectocarpus sp. 12 AP-2014]
SLITVASSWPIVMFYVSHSYFVFFSPKYVPVHTGGLVRFDPEPTTATTRGAKRDKNYLSALRGHRVRSFRCFLGLLLYSITLVSRPVTTTNAAWSNGGAGLNVDNETRTTTTNQPQNMSTPRSPMTSFRSLVVKLIASAGEDQAFCSVPAL